MCKSFGLYPHFPWFKCAPRQKVRQKEAGPTLNSVMELYSLRRPIGKHGVRRRRNVTGRVFSSMRHGSLDQADLVDLDLSSASCQGVPTSSTGLSSVVCCKSLLFCIRAFPASWSGPSYCTETSQKRKRPPSTRRFASHLNSWSCWRSGPSGGTFPSTRPRSTGGRG